MLLTLDFNLDVPIYQQIRDQIVLGVAQGRLAPGERLPSIRALAQEAGVNMMTVSKAYQLLRQEGYVVSDRRSGVCVAGSPPATGLEERTRRALRLAVSEARLHAVPLEELLELCRSYYNQSETEGDKCSN